MPPCDALSCAAAGPHQERRTCDLTPRALQEHGQARLPHQAARIVASAAVHRQPHAEPRGSELANGRDAWYKPGQWLCPGSRWNC